MYQCPHDAWQSGGDLDCQGQYAGLGFRGEGIRNIRHSSHVLPRAWPFTIRTLLAVVILALATSTSNFVSNVFIWGTVQYWHQFGSWMAIMFISHYDYLLMPIVFFCMLYTQHPTHFREMATSWRMHRCPLHVGVISFFSAVCVDCARRLSMREVWAHQVHGGRVWYWKDASDVGLVRCCLNAALNPAILKCTYTML